MSAIAIGEWVHASDSREFDLKRRGAVGVLIRIWYLYGKPIYEVGKDEGHTFGNYFHIRRVTKPEGREILKGYRELWSEWRPPKTPLFDQIWQVLINEHKGSLTSDGEEESMGPWTGGITPVEVRKS